MSSLDGLRAWLVAHLAARTGVDPAVIDAGERFQRLGLGSLDVTGMLVELGAALGRTLPPTMAWEYPTPEALARQLARGSAEDAEPAIAQAPAVAGEPIAIVGMACRFPGAASLEAFWALLRDGVDAITEVPPGRWDVGALYDPDPSAPGKLSSRWGGFLPDIEGFDPAFFGISPREAAQIDPQQRLMLELSWEALEEAGIPPASLKDTRTGVFFGAMWMDYARLADTAQIAQHTATGQDLSIIPARVSYSLGLAGPSIAVNTACSSSLVAVHVARQSLLSGESRMALAGAVNLLIGPEGTIAMTKLGAMAPDGRSKAFDARANGYVRGEGGAVIVMKRLSDALADGDHIHCVLRGSALNNDGFSNGLTAPSPRAQEGVLRDACQSAGIAPSDVQYVEAHGTGTMLGDPIEAGALGAVLGRGRTPERALRVGSVKTNIGHLEAAAGMAGLIKVALAMEHRALPPSLHFQKPNPHIPFEALRLRVQTALEPWEGEGGKLVAGISSFGFGGTNSHVVLEASVAEAPRLFVLSADTEDELRARARALGDELRAAGGPSLGEVCGAAGSNAHGVFRLAAVVRSRAELSRHLLAHAAGQPSAGLVVGQAERRPRVAMLFTGQGAQYAGMGKRLHESEPAFRAALDRCAALFDAELERPLLRVMWAEAGSPDAGLLDRTAYTQPALFAIEYATVELWRAWGLRPDVVLGHSIGEIVAACVAGVLSLEDAVRLVAARGRLMDALPEGGAMIALAAEEAQVAAQVARFADRASIAAVNAPGHVVVAGAEDAVTAIAAAVGGRARRLTVSHAFHSPLMAPMRDAFREVVRGLSYRAPHTALLTNLDGERAGASIAGPEHWVRHVEAPVRFASGLAALAAEGVDVLLEVGPHPVLLGFAAGVPGLAARRVATLERGGDDGVTALTARGELFVAGAPVGLDAQEGGEGARDQLFVLSAKSGEALDAQAARLHDHLAAHPELALGDVAFSLATTRSPMEHRLAVAASSRGALLSALETAAQGETPAGAARGHVPAAGAPKVVFVFPGQGSQWAGMGRQLLAEEPAFRAALEACDRAIGAEAGLSVIEVLTSGEAASQLALIDVVQPVLFAVEVALAALWRSWGVEPDVVVGHSMGEVAAAHVAGALSLADAAAIICRRSRLLRRLCGQGEMALVELSLEEAEQALAGREDRLSVAVSNSPRSTVIAGEPAALAEVLAALEARRVFCRRVKVDVASHCPQVDPLREELIDALAGLRPQAAAVPMRSTVTGTSVMGPELSTGYWADNLRWPVRFGDAVRDLLESGHGLFVEMSPHPILTTAVEEVRIAAGREAAALGSLRREQPERAALLRTMGELYTRGYQIDWPRLFPDGGRRVPLPTYPWQRERHWLDAARSAPVRDAEATDHPAPDAKAPSAGFHAIGWPEIPLPAGPETRPEGSWVVVAPEGSASAERLCARLDRCLRTEPSGLAAALEQAGAPVGVVCFWEAADGEDVPAAAHRLTAEGLAAVQALHARGTKARLWWVTAGAVAVRAGEPVSVAAAPVWGLGRAVMQEMPELECTLIDLPPGGDDTGDLLRELSASDGESQVAFRRGRRHAARLVRAEASRPAAGKVPELPREGTILVTGGLGAIGLHIARWLAEQGAAHLLLTGRRGRSTPGAEAALAEVEALGARVTVAAVDIADAEALKAVLDAIPADRPLRGVVHAAGVFETGMLATQAAERVAEVLRPKVDGAWNLHRLTAGQHLDFFVLFSSVAAMLSGGGTGIYAAANAFPDALAAHRRAEGLPAQSLAWGEWSGTGMSATLDPALLSRLGRQGLGSLSSTQGAALFGQALARSEAHLGVFPLDVGAARASFGPAVPALWRALVRPSAARPKAAARGEWAVGLAALPPARRLDEVRAAVQADVARVLSLGKAGAVPLDRPLREMGLDSLLAVELRNALGVRTGRSLPATLAFDYPTVDALSRWLLGEVLAESKPAAPAPKAAPTVAAGEPVAVIGIGCRFPGGVTSPEAFWRLLEEGADAVTEVPRSRWDVDAWYDPDPDAPGKVTTRWGGFLPDIEQFDADFFGITPREAPSIDPQERLLLETCWEAIERAGTAPDRLMGSDTAVYIGLSSSDYQARSMADPGAIDAYALVNTSHSAIVGRISYWLGLEGPNLAVDTACSSSLVAVHLACQALRHGECSMALAGGVNVLLGPESTVSLSRMRVVSPTGRCRTFSADADGFVRSEGCGVLVLKRLSDARRDGDTVLAVIRGTAVNQDGRSNGPTAPNGPAQQAVVRRALAQAGVAPPEIGYVECHGTGTLLGDPIEVQALGAALGEGRAPERPVVLGSVKSNIGHTETAAGVAGVIKTVLALQHGRIPRSLHAGALNPHIAWGELPVKVATEAVEWPRNGAPRFAGVSSFGISGTNAHVILEEAPAAEPVPEAPGAPAALFVVSGKSPVSMRMQAARLREHLAAHPELGLNDVAFSLATTRSHHEHRVAVAAPSRDALLAALDAAAQGQATAGVTRGTSTTGGKLAFLFTGQGAQQPGMGRALHVAWPAFRDAFDRCAALFDRELGRSLREVMWAEPGSAEAALLDRTDFTQPALFVFEHALFSLWRSWGVEPSFLAGHSVGELVAACAAGVFSLDDAVRLCAARGRLMQALPEAGVMVALAATEAAAAAALAPYAGRAAIAAVNGPEQAVIAGGSEEVRAIADDLQSRGVCARRLAVSHAFHSPLMEPMLEAFREVAAKVVYRPAEVPVVSCLTGAAAGEELSTAEHWVRHAREAVRFAGGIRALAEAGVRTFVELGPRATLLGLVPACVPEIEVRLLASSRYGQDEVASALDALGGVWTGGGAVAWTGVFPAGGRRTPLPTYSWQRRRYWIEPTTQARLPAGSACATLPFRAPPEPVPPSEGGAAAELRRVAPAERAGLVLRHVCEVIAQVLRLGSPEDVDTAKGVMTYGADSLMWVQIKTRLETALALPRPISPLWPFEHPTAADLAAHLVNDLLWPHVQDGGAAVKAPPAPERVEHASAPAPARTWLADHEQTFLLEGRRAVCAHRPGGGNDGPTLLLLHGAGGSHHGFADLCRELPDFDVLVPSLPGHGGSDGPPLATVAEMAAWVRALLEAQGLRRVVAVGHSMGGAIAQELAIAEVDLPAFDRRLEALCLLATGPRLPISDELEGILLALAREGSADVRLRAIRRTMSPETSEELMRKSAAAFDLTAPSGTVEADIAACNAFDRMDSLHWLDLPVLTLAGSADRMTPSRYAKALNSRLRNGQLIQIEGAGHLLPAEEPALVAAHIRRFLSEGKRGGASR